MRPAPGDCVRMPPPIGPGSRIPPPRMPPPIPMPIPMPMPCITAPGGGPCGPAGWPDCAMSASVGAFGPRGVSARFRFGGVSSSLGFLMTGMLTGTVTGEHVQVGAVDALVGCGELVGFGALLPDGEFDGPVEPLGEIAAAPAGNAALAVSVRLRTRSSSLNAVGARSLFG